MTLPHRLDRTVPIRARRENVFAFLTESDKWASWWGAGSTIDPRPGGRMLIRHPNGVEASGAVEEIVAPERVTFSYGYDSGQAAPSAGSRVTIRLEADLQGTRLHLTHEFADLSARDVHVQGWRFQLSLLANAVSNSLNADVAALTDLWFAAWSDPDANSRDTRLAELAAPGLRLEDRYSCLEGIGEVRAHLAAVHRFMPGMRLLRQGDVRHCQASVLADWLAVGADGQERARGTHLFRLDADGRIEAVTGFWPGQ